MVTRCLARGRNRPLRLHVGALCSLAILASACDDSSSPGISSPIDVSGRVLAAENGRPVGDVTVIAPDGREVQSDANGQFNLVYGKDNKGSIKARSTIAAPVEKPAPKGKGYVELYVKAYDGQVEIESEAGGDVSGGGARAKVNAGSLQSTKGSLEKTRLVIAAPDPKRATDLPSVPGNFDAQQQSTDKRGKLSLKSPVFVGAEGSGEELSLKDGQKASIELPIRDNDKKAAGDARTLYRYDFAQGIWIQEGTAVETTDANGQPVYHAEIGALGWWTVGDFYEQLTCLRGCVTNRDGSPATHARVLVNAIEHETQILAYAGEDGCYAVDVIAQARLSVSAQSQEGFAQPVVLTSGTGAAAADTAPATCQEIATLALQPVSSGACGQGLSECNGTCVDTSFDPNHCGNCATTCASGQCVSAQCMDPSMPAPMDDAGMPDAAMDPVDEPVLPTQTLTVSRGGTGTGSISSLPLGITCGATCQHAFAEGVSVTLKATPGANSRFVGWAGDCAASGTSDCTLSMDRARNASATFELASRILTVSVTGETLGNVVGVAGTSQVVNCGNLGTDCTETLAHGASVVLTATPATNMQFTWGGVCAGVLTANCTVPMDGAKFVSITFSPIQYTLTFVTKDQGIAPPVGYGTVTMVSPATGFVCENDYLNASMQCTHVFNAGTVVQLHAAGQGYDAFMAWGGACAAFTINQDCVLTMNGNLSAFADFAGVIF